MKLIKAYRNFMIVLILGILLFCSSAVVTYPNEYSLIKQFGAVVRQVTEPGLSFKIPFIQTVQSVPKYLLCYDLAPTDVNTADKKMMTVDSFALWRIIDPLKYVTTIGASQSTAEGRINNVVYNSVKTVMSSTLQDDVISGRDGELATMITDAVLNSLNTYGIQITKVETKMLDLPQENRESVYTRMISERENISAGYTADGKSQAKKLRNETDKEINIKLSEANAKAEQLRAEGDEEYMKIMSSFYGVASKAEFYEFVRGLDSLKKSINSEDKTIILDGNSDFAKILSGIN